MGLGVIIASPVMDIFGVAATDSAGLAMMLAFGVAVAITCRSKPLGVSAPTLLPLATPLPTALLFFADAVRGCFSARPSKMTFRIRVRGVASVLDFACFPTELRTVVFLVEARDPRLGVLFFADDATDFLFAALPDRDGVGLVNLFTESQVSCNGVRIRSSSRSYTYQQQKVDTIRATSDI